MTVIVSGIAPHSLGSALVDLLLRNGAKVVGVDVEINHLFEEGPTFRFVMCDLNPWRNNIDWTLHWERLTESLRRAVSDLGESGVSTLVQSAGVYWSGEFMRTASTTRSALLGVNTVARVELLHAVMSLNDETGILNDEQLTHIDIGSLHGVCLQSGRSLYAASKAFGVALATVMDAGRELRRSIYVAPGPIDTYMLHFNHWVVKSGGRSVFIENLRKGDPTVYDAIFRECSEPALLRSITGLGAEDQARELLKTYKSHREAAFAAQSGVISARHCAEVVHSLVASDCKSGIYLVTHSPTGGVKVERSDLECGTPARLAVLR